MGDEEFLGVVAILAVFMGPVLITRMVLKYRLKRKIAESASKDEIEALRREIADLRVDMQARLADITLMIDDAMRQALQSVAKRRFEQEPDEEDG